MEGAGCLVGSDSFLYAAVGPEELVVARIVAAGGGLHLLLVEGGNVVASHIAATELVGLRQCLVHGVGVDRLVAYVLPIPADLLFQ